MSASGFVADVLAQPGALRDTLAVLAAPRREVRELAARFRVGQGHRLVLTGVGASHAALNWLLFRLTPLGFCPLLVETGELLGEAGAVMNEQAVLVVVSQSGRTAEVVDLLAAAAGRTVVAVTNDPSSPLARGAAHVYATRAGGEHSVPCKTYVTALAALAALAGDFAARPRVSDLELLGAAADAMGAYLDGWEAKAAELAERLGGARSLLVCGRGYSLGSAIAGAMTLREAARTHAEAVSGAQFRHGHMEMIQSGAAVLMLRGAESSAPMQEKLARDIEERGGTVVMVGSGSDGAARLPDCDPTTLALLEILPAQLAAIGLARRQGIEPGVFTAHQKVQTER